MRNIETLNVFKFNNRVLHTNLQNITQEESLIAPEKGGSCINWIMGHITICRDEIHELIGIPKFCDQRYYKLYGQGTKGHSFENAFSLEKMLELFDGSQMKMTEAVENYDFANDQKKLERLTFYAFHEAYHIGQIGILRRIIGKEGAIK